MTESTRNLGEENRSHCSPIDQALIKACLTGDAQAWNTFVKRFGRLIRAVVTKTAQRRGWSITCLLYTSPSPRDTEVSRMPSSA